MSRFDAQLRAAGLSAEASAAKSATLDTLTDALREWRADESAELFLFVPGRVELAGKHTDYAGGRSLVCAIDRGICLAAASRSDARVRIRDVALESEVTFPFDAGIEPTAGHWSNFPMTVVRRFALDFPGARTGADIVFASDLPLASGMSSSSALIVAVLVALTRVSRLTDTERYRHAIATHEDLAGYAAAIESGASFGAFGGDRGVGTHGGSEDHVAILCSRAGRLRQYSYCPVRFEREVTLPDQYALVIGASGVIAEKTGAARDAYNRASGAARAILELWRRAVDRDAPSLAAVLASDDRVADELRRLLRTSSIAGYPRDLLLDRLAHFDEESNRIVPAVAEALSSGDVEALGAIVHRSQHLAERLLANQVPETIALARSARELGAAAASAFGAGFGGAVWALIETARAETFLRAWAAQYHQRFPRRTEASRFFVSRPGPGVQELHR